MKKYIAWLILLVVAVCFCASMATMFWLDPKSLLFFLGFFCVACTLQYWLMWALDIAGVQKKD